LADTPGVLGALIGLVVTWPTLYVIYLQVRPFLRATEGERSTVALTAFAGGLPALWIGGPVIASNNPIVSLDLPRPDVLMYLLMVVVFNIVPLAFIFVRAFVPDLMRSIATFEHEEVKS
jgi:hypothetical protein